MVPTSATKENHSVEDYVDFLVGLVRLGVDFVVIGGCAVGVYARRAGVPCLSRDLDLYAGPQEIEEILAWAPSVGATVLKRPTPRSLGVAVLDWRGLEVNIISGSEGLPPPELAARACIELTLHGVDQALPIADPLDLLCNKLKLNRPKDAPHIAILRSFVETEAVVGFKEGVSALERTSYLRRLLRVLGTDRLPPDLFEKLLPHARTATDYRFLAHRAPGHADGARVIAAAEALGDPALLDALRAIDDAR